MKKVFLSFVLLFVFTISFAANNVEKVTCDAADAVEYVKSMSTTSDAYSVEVADVTKDFGTCVIDISFIGEDGEVLGGATLIITGVGSAEECDQIADDIANMMNQ